MSFKNLLDHKNLFYQIIRIRAEQIRTLLDTALSFFTFVDSAFAETFKSLSYKLFYK